MTTSTAQITKIGTVCVPVADQDGAIAFYTGKLGFTKTVDVPFGGDYRWVEVGLPGAETTIALAPPPPGAPSGGMQTGIALNTTDIDGVHAAWKAAGVDVDDQVARMGPDVPPMFWLRDPEQNVLLVVEVS